MTPEGIGSYTIAPSGPHTAGQQGNMLSSLRRWGWSGRRHSYYAGGGWSCPRTILMYVDEHGETGPTEVSCTLDCGMLRETRHHERGGSQKLPSRPGEESLIRAGSRTHRVLRNPSQSRRSMGPPCTRWTRRSYNWWVRLRSRNPGRGRLSKHRAGSPLPML